MGIKCLAVCPVLIVSGRELGGKILDKTLPPILELSIGLQPLSRSQLHERMHFKGPIYSNGEERVAPQYLYAIFKPVVLAGIRYVIVITFIVFSTIILTAPFMASSTISSFRSLPNHGFRDALSVKEAHQRQQVGCRWPSFTNMFERDLPCNKNGVFGLPVSPQLASLIIQKTSLLAIALPEVFEISLHRIPRCPLRDVRRRLNDGKRHEFQCFY